MEENINCPHCRSNIKIKRGFNVKNEQIYQCKKCLKRFTGQEKYHRASKECIEGIYKLRKEGLSKEAIARFYGFKSAESITYHLKKDNIKAIEYDKYRKNLINKNDLSFIADEMYVFIGAKNKRFYLFTGVFIDIDNNYYPVCKLRKNKSVSDLDEFMIELPKPKIVYSDNNPIYKDYFGRNNISKKGIETNKIESINSMIRQYSGYLHRKSKQYPKSFNNLDLDIKGVFVDKIIGKFMNKRH